MNKLIPSLFIGFLLFGSIACSNTARTSNSSPDSANQPTNKTLDQPTAQDNQSDANSDIRRKQLESDIRAREQRNQATNNGSAANRSDADLASEVRSKLEANLPASQLTIEVKDGSATVSGNVVSQEQFNKIEPLAKEISGITSVVVNAKVDAAAQPSKP